MVCMAGSGTADNHTDQHDRTTVTDPGVDEMLREAGFTITVAGKERWRRRLAKPMSAEALAEGRRLRQRARGHAA
jgi:hypothetical protein